MSAYGGASMFNSQGRLGADATDATQQSLQNTRFANYMLSSFFSDSASDAHVMFATQQPAMMSSGTVYGGGLSGSAVDMDSRLTIHQQNRCIRRSDSCPNETHQATVIACMRIAYRQPFVVAAKYAHVFCSDYRKSQQC